MAPFRYRLVNVFAADELLGHFRAQRQSACASSRMRGDWASAK